MLSVLKLGMISKNFISPVFAFLSCFIEMKCTEAGRDINDMVSRSVRRLYFFETIDYSAINTYNTFFFLGKCRMRLAIKADMKHFSTWVAFYYCTLMIWKIPVLLTGCRMSDCAMLRDVEWGLNWFSFVSCVILYAGVWRSPWWSHEWRILFLK